MNAFIIFLLIGFASVIYGISVLHPLLIRLYQTNILDDNKMDGCGFPSGVGWIMITGCIMPPVVVVVIILTIVVHSQNIWLTIGTASTASRFLKKVAGE